MARRPAARGDGTRRCPGCGAPTIRQLVGQRAALHITADLAPLSLEEQQQLREPDRLIWCLHQTTHGPPELRWITSWHPADCPHPHVTEHRCEPTQPATLF